MFPTLFDRLFSFADYVYEQITDFFSFFVLNIVTFILWIIAKRRFNMIDYWIWIYWFSIKGHNFYEFLSYIIFIGGLIVSSILMHVYDVLSNLREG